jgi:hypothetical protein
MKDKQTYFKFILQKEDSFYYWFIIHFISWIYCLLIYLKHNNPFCFLYTIVPFGLYFLFYTESYINFKSYYHKKAKLKNQNIRYQQIDELIQLSYKPEKMTIFKQSREVKINIPDQEKKCKIIIDNQYINIFFTKYEFGIFKRYLKPYELKIIECQDHIYSKHIELRINYKGIKTIWIKNDTKSYKTIENFIKNANN